MQRGKRVEGTKNSSEKACQETAVVPWERLVSDPGCFLCTLPSSLIQPPIHHHPPTHHLSIHPFNKFIKQPQCAKHSTYAGNSAVMSHRGTAILMKQAILKDIAVTPLHRWMCGCSVDKGQGARTIGQGPVLITVLFSRSE